MQADIAIVGGGLAGSVAAAVLSRAGGSVVVVDRHACYPPEFRAEQLVGGQVAALRRLGLLDGIVAGVPAIPTATSACHGRVIDVVHCPHYGIRYEDMVNAVRAQAAGACFVTGRVTDVQTGPDRQQVGLADGRCLAARLVVLATGPHPADPLLRSLGIERRMVSRHHSTTFGFDLRAGLSRVLTYYGEDIRDRMDYLTVFPMGQGLRANLFAYRRLHAPWTQAFAGRPREMLLGVMPALARVLGGFEITGKVQMRTNHLPRAEHVRRDGVVLIGDAFQTSCPAAGTGSGRLLTDVETLLACLPRWLATPGLAAAKIGAFYDDPAKRAFDAEALRVARYRRDLCTQTNLAWQIHRARVHWQRKARHLARQAGQGAAALGRRVWPPPGPDLDLGDGLDPIG